MADMRSVDAFFARHGYMNVWRAHGSHSTSPCTHHCIYAYSLHLTVMCALMCEEVQVETFLLTDGSYLDNLYWRRPGGALTYPNASGPCTAEDRKMGMCVGAADGMWKDWATHSGEWGRCKQ